MKVEREKGVDGKAGKQYHVELETATLQRVAVRKYVRHRKMDKASAMIGGSIYGNGDGVLTETADPTGA